MMTEFRHIVALIKTMESNVENLVSNYKNLVEEISKLKEENKKLTDKLKKYDECKANSEESTQEISNDES